MKKVYLYSKTQLTHAGGGLFINNKKAVMIPPYLLVLLDKTGIIGDHGPRRGKIHRPQTVVRCSNVLKTNKMGRFRITKVVVLHYFIINLTKNSPSLRWNGMKTTSNWLFSRLVWFVSVPACVPRSRTGTENLSRHSTDSTVVPCTGTEIVT